MLQDDRGYATEGLVEDGVRCSVCGMVLKSGRPFAIIDGVAYCGVDDPKRETPALDALVVEPEPTDEQATRIANLEAELATWKGVGLSTLAGRYLRDHGVTPDADPKRLAQQVARIMRDEQKGEGG